MTTEQKLVSFGRYLLSQERTDRVKSNEALSDIVEERLADVSDADVYNWKEKVGLPLEEEI